MLMLHCLGLSCAQKRYENLRKKNATKQIIVVREHLKVLFGSWKV